jgi:hypothetical protein
VPAVQILLNQSGKPAGVAGQAREDLDTGVSVSASTVGGPYSAYQWSFLSRPDNVTTGVEATTAFSASTSSSTVLSPIDQAGTYLLQLAVDSGSGLGATSDDVAQIEFYAGVPGDPIVGPLNTDPAELPRRPIAFRERRQGNFPDSIEPLGNTTGWAREWYRWWAVIERMYQGKSWAVGRVTGDPVTPVLVRGFNVIQAGISRIATGNVQVTFVRPMPDANYVVIPSLLNTAGIVSVNTITATHFRVLTKDTSFVAQDYDFGFDVKLGV